MMFGGGFGDAEGLGRVGDGQSGEESQLDQFDRCAKGDLLSRFRAFQSRLIQKTGDGKRVFVIWRRFGTVKG